MRSGSSGGRTTGSTNETTFVDIASVVEKACSGPYGAPMYAQFH
jgi:hypothetical protein